MNSESILLDTHIWLWLMTGDVTLSKKSQTLIRKLASQNRVFLSAISVWEVSMLEAKKRIILQKPVDDWISNALSAPGLNLVPLSPKIAVESTRLPGKFHSDPADRIIVSTARIEGLTLLTRDQRILQYSKKKHVNAIKA